ncbi:MAG TPA: DnaJ domain-containing protein [Stellaceae bacterium]|nr:DnaJ domain-containing protein [Stellaceae bacterium]
MLYLLGGFLILCGLLLLGYLFVNTEPARLARGLKWTGIGIAGAAVVAIVVTGRINLLWMLLALGLPLLRRLRTMFAGFRDTSPGHSSTVETLFVRMGLDHDTGTMTGTVLRGQFAGMRLEELGRDDLVALLRECRAADEESARLIEAYLDRAHPDWHEDFGGARSEYRASAAGPDVTVEEAYAILGLAPGADAEAIKAAHRRLMKQLHPDHGGTDYLATKINRARDVLLHR